MDKLRHLKCLIARLKHPGMTPGPIEYTDAQLSEVQHILGEYADKILLATEKIKVISSLVSMSPTSDPESVKAADDILLECDRIMEACAFQDLSGQRIQRLQSLAKDLKTSTDQLIQFTGGANAYNDIPLPKQPVGNISIGGANLSGPSFDSSALNQDEVDNMFD